MNGTREEERAVKVKITDLYGRHLVECYVHVPVLIIPYCWGEDADGRRGMWREEILPNMDEAFIPSRKLLGMTDLQVTAAMKTAESKILNGEA